MIKLDDNLLTELGLQTLPPEEKRALLKQIYETLEMRVGTTLARQMTDSQLDEFEGFITRNDEQGALHWLETNFPNYKDVVSQELTELRSLEVRPLCYVVFGFWHMLFLQQQNHQRLRYLAQLMRWRWDLCPAPYVLQ